MSFYIFQSVRVCQSIYLSFFITILTSSYQSLHLAINLFVNISEFVYINVFSQTFRYRQDIMQCHFLMAV